MKAGPLCLGSEAEIGSDHWLSSVRECSRRGVQPGDIGRLIEVAAVLESQTDVRKQTPIQARSVHIDRLGRGAGICLPTAWNIQKKTDAKNRKGA